MNHGLWRTPNHLFCLASSNFVINKFLLDLTFFVSIIQHLHFVNSWITYNSSIDSHCQVLHALEDCLPDDSILVADGGDFVGTAAYVLRPRGPLRYTVYIRTRAPAWLRAYLNKGLVWKAFQKNNSPCLNSRPVNISAQPTLTPTVCSAMQRAIICNFVKQAVTYSKFLTITNLFMSNLNKLCNIFIKKL